MPNDLTGEFDVCLQLSPGAVNMVVAAFSRPASVNGPALLAHDGPSLLAVARVPTHAPPAPVDDAASRVQLLRGAVAVLAALLPSTVAVQVAGIEAVGGGAAVFANLLDIPLPNAPVPDAEAFFDDDGFGIALSRECVESLVRRAITGVSVPNQFEVRLKGQRGAGLVRWNVTVDLGSAGTVLHAGGTLGAGYEDMPQAVLVAVPGAAIARGVASLYAELDFTFELLVPFAPEVAADRIVFRPGEAQFRLLRVPIALDPFRSKIVTTVRQHLSVVQDGISFPATLDLGHAAPALRGGERAIRPTLQGADIRDGALVFRGRLGLESPMPPRRAASAMETS